MAIDLGDVHRLRFTNRSAAGVPTATDEVTLTITRPDDTDVTFGPIAPSGSGDGEYVYDFLTTQAGRHQARWVSTGVAPSAYVESFDVLPADLPYIISLSDAKEQLNIETPHEDEELRLYLGATTWVIENHLSQATYRRTVTEEYIVEPGRPLVLAWPPVVEILAMSLVDGTYTWDMSTLHCTPHGVVTSPRHRGPEGHLAITYVAGSNLVPLNIQNAARIILQANWQTQRGSRQGSQAQAPWGAAKAGGLENSVSVVGKGFEIPNNALMLLGTGPGFA